MKIEDTLLEVYPEAKDFVASLRDYGDLDRARIADKHSSPRAFPSKAYLYQLEPGERIWCVGYNCGELVCDQPVRMFGQPTGKLRRDLEYFDPTDPRTWAELGIRLNRYDPLIYIVTQDGNEWAKRLIETGDGFVPGKEKEHFEKLRQLYEVVFHKKVSPEELDEWDESYKHLTLEI